MRFISAPPGSAMIRTHTAPTFGPRRSGNLEEPILRAFSNSSASPRPLSITRRIGLSSKAKLLEITCQAFESGPWRWLTLLLRRSDSSLSRGIFITSEGSKSSGRDLKNSAAACHRLFESRARSIAETKVRNRRTVAFGLAGITHLLNGFYLRHLRP